MSHDGIVRVERSVTFSSHAGCAPISVSMAEVDPHWWPVDSSQINDTEVLQYPFPIPPPPQPLVYCEIFHKVITMLSHLLFSFLSSILSYTGWSVSGAGGADGSCPVSLCLQQRMVYQLQEISSALNGSVMCTTDGRTL